MKQLSIKPGDSIVVDGFDGDIILTFVHLNSVSAELTVNAPEDVSVKRGKKAVPEPKPDAEIQRDLEDSMEDVISLLAELDSALSQEILTKFVSELFYHGRISSVRGMRRPICGLKPKSWIVSPSLVFDSVGAGRVPPARSAPSGGETVL